MFPGKNEVQQVSLIQQMLGPQQWKNQCPLKVRYQSKLSSEGLAFLSQLLKLNPAERLTAADALQHSYFHSRIQRVQPRDLRVRKPLQRSNLSNTDLLHKHMTVEPVEASAKLLRWRWNQSLLLPGRKALQVRKLSRGPRVLPLCNSTVY